MLKFMGKRTLMSKEGNQRIPHQLSLGSARGDNSQQPSIMGTKIELFDSSLLGVQSRLFDDFLSVTGDIQISLWLKLNLPLN